MKTFYRWIAGHPRISRAIMALVITGFCFVALNPNLIPFLPRFLIIFLLLSSGFTFLNTIPEQLLREPLHILEQQCDPYPLLEELEKQLPLCREDLQGAVTRLNYAMALGHAGQHETALDVLRNVDLDRFPNASPFIRFFYYNSLADLHTRLNNYALADLSSREALAVYDSIPQSKAKAQLDKTVQMNQMRAYFRDGDYAAALRGLGDRKSDYHRCRENRF